MIKYWTLRCCSHFDVVIFFCRMFWVRQTSSWMGCLRFPLLMTLSVWVHYFCNMFELLTWFWGRRDTSSDLRELMVATVQPWTYNSTTSWIVQNKTSKTDIWFWTLRADTGCRDSTGLRFDLCSFVFQGMEFIHKSNLKFHGNLKPSTCLVDSRLQIKLSGFGLWEFKYGNKNKMIQPPNVNYEGQWVFRDLQYVCIHVYHDGEVARVRRCGCSSVTFSLAGCAVEMYWTAPELLRQVGLPVHGTPKGDIYSFAIIMWELMYNSKTSPFQDINLEPKG